MIFWKSKSGELHAAFALVCPSCASLLCIPLKIIKISIESFVRKIWYEDDAYIKDVF